MLCVCALARGGTRGWGLQWAALLLLICRICLNLVICVNVGAAEPGRWLPSLSFLHPFISSLFSPSLLPSFLPFSLLSPSLIPCFIQTFCIHPSILPFSLPRAFLSSDSFSPDSTFFVLWLYFFLKTKKVLFFKLSKQGVNMSEMRKHGRNLLLLAHQDQIQLWKACCPFISLVPVNYLSKKSGTTPWESKT